MTPTNKLRFVARNTNDPHAPRTLKILQQWWEYTAWDYVSKFVDGKFVPQGEWRDVTVEKEE